MNLILINIILKGSQQQVEETSTQDEPYRLVHEVVKPVIQEVREVIQPYRNVVQTIKPVIEHVNTIVSRGEKKINSDSGDNSSPIKNILENDYKNSKPTYGRSSSSFDSSISQRTIDSDISHTTDNYGSVDSGYSASNGVIYRIGPLLNSRSNVFDNININSDDYENADFSHQYFTVRPIYRFFK